MENASKALIMAGEILIGIMVLGVLIYGYTNIRSLNLGEQGNKQSEQLAAFNKEYESYNRKLIRGVDVISVINKAINNNIKYEYENAYNISISFKIIEEVTPLKEGTYTISKNTDDTYQILFNTNTETFTNFKRKIFDCTGVEYNKLGRICKVNFVERKIE